MMFFSMLVMYSAFVLTSVSTKYYVLNIGRVFEYYVYFWGAGDLIEELISCFVRIFSGVVIPQHNENKNEESYTWQLAKLVFSFANNAITQSLIQILYKFESKAKYFISN